MRADLARGIAEGLELRDLLALQADDACQHRAGHEGGDAEEDHGEGHGDAVQDRDLVVELLGRGMVSAVVGDQPPVGLEQSVELGHDRRRVGPGSDIHHHVVEGPVEVERRREVALVHPEDAEPLAVREGLARARLENILRREGHAHDGEPLAAAAQDDVHRVAGREAVGLGEGFAHDDFAGFARLGKPPGAQVEQVQALRTVVGQRDHAAVGRFGHPGQVEANGADHAGLDRGDPGDLGQPLAQGVGCAFQFAEDVAETVAFVVGGAGGFERKDEAACHDHHGEPAGHDETHRHDLALHFSEVADELEVEGGHGFTRRGNGRAGAWRCARCGKPSRPTGGSRGRPSRP